MRCLSLPLAAIASLLTWQTVQSAPPPSVDPAARAAAQDAAAYANEGFLRSNRYMHAWLDVADPVSGLIPRRVVNFPWEPAGLGPIWDPKDSAADNYPFMVLTAAMTDRSKYDGAMVDILDTERQLTSRLYGVLPDIFSFPTQDFYHSNANAARINFGTAEYIKDGLMPIAEWTGMQTPWAARMIEMVDAVWENASISTPLGPIPNAGGGNDTFEAHGEYLQVLSRLYWATGEDKYLEWAVRLGDRYLLTAGHHPTDDRNRLLLRDHGNEVIGGLSELYATLTFADPDKAQEYQEPLRRMLDRILEVGRNADGLFYNEINPKNGSVTNSGIADTFGYVLNAYLTVDLVDGTSDYQDAVLTVLNVLDAKYRNFQWEAPPTAADGYADAIESVLNLINRVPSESAESWLNSEVHRLWNFQDTGEFANSGIIEGWHGDGNFARTSLMFALWKTQGVTVDEWREDLKFGAGTTEDGILLEIFGDTEWSGHLIFDTARHAELLNLPLDWARINQFQEWFTVDLNELYYVWEDGVLKGIFTGESLADGLPFSLAGGEWRTVQVSPVPEPTALVPFAIAALFSARRQRRRVRG